MKQRIIEALKKVGGLDDARAEKHYAVFVREAYGDDEPTAEQLGLLTEGDLVKIPSGQARTIWAAVQSLGPAPQAETPKGKGFKTKKAAEYTAKDLALFVADDPKGETEGLRAAVDAKTRGQAFRFLVDGKLDVDATAERIAALAKGAPVAPFVVIGDKEVTPIGWDLNEAVEDKEDPYERGEPLGQPRDVSTRLGLSLEGISDETRQAIDCAVQLDLADASVRELQADARRAVGVSPAEYLAEHPKARRAWTTWVRRELRLPRRPFGEPAAPVAPRGGPESPAPSGKPPLVYVVGAARDRVTREAAETLARHLKPLAKSGAIRFATDDGCLAGQNVAQWRDQHWRDTALFVPLLSAETLSDNDVEAAVMSGRKCMPVVVQACAWNLVAPFKGRTCLPRSGRPATTDADWTEVSKEIMGLVERLGLKDQWA